RARQRISGRHAEAACPEVKGEDDLRRHRASSMPDVRADGVEVDTQQAAGGVPAALEGDVEKNALVARYGEPGVLRELAFELTRAPARIAQRDDRDLGTGPVRHGGENV